MLIDQGKLIALLVEKTGYEKEKVEQHLAELADRINEISEQGDFTIEGFGTFTRRDGAITFKPAEKLKTEINQKYAGMQPIELIEAYKQAGRGVPVEQESQPKPGQKKPQKEQPDQPEKAKETEPEIAEESLLPEQPPVKESPKAEKGKIKKRYPAKKRNHAGGILVAVIIIIIILAGGFYWFNNGGTGVVSTIGSSESTALTNNNRPERVASADDPGPGQNMQVDSMEQNAPDSVSQKEMQLRQSPGSTYGLKGLATNEGNNGYTIIIHSFRLKSTVESIADSLKNEGYRTVLINADVENSNWWRLGLGQFKTVHDAQAAVAALPQKYRAPDKHYIKHI